MSSPGPRRPARRGSAPRPWRLLAALAALALAPTGRAAEAPEGLRLSLAVDGAVTGAALLAVVVAEFGSGSLGPVACRWCNPPGLDASVRRALVWGDPGLAEVASDVLLLAVPAGFAAYDLLEVRAGGGGGGRVAADWLVVAEAVAVAGFLTEAAKYATARERPDAYYGRASGRDEELSFASLHASAAFAAAAAGGTVARLRGYAGWPFVYAAGFTGAALTGYLRIAADKHWLSDVLSGAAAGTAVGVLVPWLHRDGRDPKALRLVPWPGGLALAGRF